MKWTAILASVGHALMSGAQKFEETATGQTVATDVKKTLSDGAIAAIGLVRQGATQQATDAASAALSKLGVPASAASVLAGFAVSQGEGFLTSLIPAA